MSARYVSAMVASKLTMFLGPGASLAAPANLPVFRWKTISPRVSESISGIETGRADLRRERVVRHHAFVRSQRDRRDTLGGCRSFFLARQRVRGVDHATKSLNEMFRARLVGQLSDDVDNLTGVAPRTFREWCERHVDELR
jgi:hypothetical protein